MPTELSAEEEAALRGQISILVQMTVALAGTSPIAQLSEEIGQPALAQAFGGAVGALASKSGRPQAFIRIVAMEIDRMLAIIAEDEATLPTASVAPGEQG